MSKLADAFNIRYDGVTANKLNDYDVFEDKILLEELRTKIAESLVDKGLVEFTKESITNEIIEATENVDLSPQERHYLFNLIDNEVSGYGPLTNALNNDSVTEIMVNSPKDIYIEVNGSIIKDESISFINEEHIFRTIQKLTESSGKVVDIKNPIVDVHSAAGYRINAMIPPLSLNGPVMTIRKDPPLVYTMEDLIRKGTLTPYMARFLAVAVASKLNILVCGNVASGKSTLINVLANLIGEEERVIAIEDVTKLDLVHKNSILLQTGDVETNALIKNAVKMHPNRIVVGDIKGREAYEVLQIMSVGYNGTIASMHATNSLDSLNRLLTLCTMSGYDVSLGALRDYIAKSIDLVVYVECMTDGKRKVTSITEITSTTASDFIVSDIFEFKKKGLARSGEVLGEFVLYSKTPRILKKLKECGITDLNDIFHADGVDLPSLI